MSNVHGYTFGIARGECRQFQCTLSSRDGQYTVRPLWDRSSSYETNDLTDAVNTARAMYKEMDQFMKSTVPQITVNSLINKLLELQKQGRGDNLVFVRSDGFDWCPRMSKIEAYHTTKSGHVVISGEDRPLTFDQEG